MDLRKRRTPQRLSKAKARGRDARSVSGRQWPALLPERSDKSPDPGRILAEQSANRVVDAMFYRAVILIGLLGVSLFLALTGSRLVTDHMHRRRLSRASA